MLHSFIGGVEDRTLLHPISLTHREVSNNYRVLKGPGGVQGEGVFLGNPEDSYRED